ncbi:hypothetical protein H8N03_07990 [Ramlibacter sp. USB13]|uniref:Glycosyltransferase RgtA/B/C/D-like domain-containing protein n=1 Tax=Ramlibacter cellulosilyticus TaxID=2764187 RepID=A0A923MRI8_9BURK|nr:hypothetical protein [Ramlibacter cellulosilyticus]MBC5782884.1 hypothetical protein [Ramlibacter cellulosilyticus]
MNNFQEGVGSWRSSRRRLARDFHRRGYASRRTPGWRTPDLAAPATDASREWAGKLLFVLALGVFLWMGLFNLGQALLEMHPFRQTQTAITAYWMQREGFSLAYPTPVLGAPWSIPFEFPLFQFLVAWIARLTGAPLDPVGRAVSLVATLAVCLPLYRSLRLLGVERGAAHYANALYLTAPVYLFWSGTFMIEGLALLLAMSAGYYLLKMYRLGVTARDLVLFGAFLTLALLQKITTGAFPAFVGLTAFAWRALGTMRHGLNLRSPVVRGALLVGAVGGLALVVGYGWVMYTDAVKVRNEFGRFLASNSPTLSGWNYGTLGQRFSKAFLVDVVLHRIVLPSTALGLGVLVLGLLFLRWSDASVKKVAALGLLLFVLPMAVLTNLHFVHDYYQTANLVFLVAAVAVAVYATSGLLVRWHPAAAPLAMAVFVAGNLLFFHGMYYPWKATILGPGNSRTLKLAEFLRNHTPADRPLLILGYDWSSELPYYAQRKALAVPPWTRMEMDAIQSTERFLPTAPSAVVSCPEENVDALRAAIAARFPQSEVVTVDDCRIYLPRP